MFSFLLGLLGSEKCNTVIFKERFSKRDFPECIMITMCASNDHLALFPSIGLTHILLRWIDKAYLHDIAMTSIKINMTLMSMGFFKEIRGC